MKICWDNLEKLEYTKNGKWRKQTSGGKWKYYSYVENCFNCKEPFLAEYKEKFCSHQCHTSGEFNGFYDKKHTDEHKQHIGKINSGKHVDKYGKEKAEKISKNHSISISGDKHWNWLGGCVDNYCDAWKDKEYKESIKERDNHTCQNFLCNSKEDLTIHHIDYNKQHCPPINLLTLCRSCNGAANFDRAWHESFYKEINRRNEIE